MARQLLLVGWFLPLFGIPLAVFLALDTVVGHFLRRRKAGLGAG
ncbi:hypothetical protein [Streptomyces sp. 8K308]|nr:hypothetical protein [Streptomyces sp. 8K308]